MIQCKECDSLIEDPCGTVTALFLQKFTLEKNASSQKEDVTKKLDAIDKLIEAKGIVNHPKLYREFKALKVKPPQIKSKLFILQCAKGHVNTYQIDCN